MDRSPLGKKTSTRPTRPLLSSVRSLQPGIPCEGRTPTTGVFSLAIVLSSFLCIVRERWDWEVGGIGEMLKRLYMEGDISRQKTGKTQHPAWSCVVLVSCLSRPSGYALHFPSFFWSLVFFLQMYLYGASFFLLPLYVFHCFRACWGVNGIFLFSFLFHEGGGERDKLVI